MFSLKPPYVDVSPRWGFSRSGGCLAQAIRWTMLPRFYSGSLQGCCTNDGHWKTPLIAFNDRICFVNVCRWRGVVYGFKFKPSGVNNRIISIQWLSFSFLYSTSSLWIFSMTIIDSSSREWSDRVKCLATGPSIHWWLMSNRCPVSHTWSALSVLQCIGWHTFYIQWGRPHSWFGSLRWLSHKTSRPLLYCVTWFPFYMYTRLAAGLLTLAVTTARFFWWTMSSSLQNVPKIRGEAIGNKGRSQKRTFQMHWCINDTLMVVENVHQVGEIWMERDH